MDYGALVLTGRATGIASPTRQGRFAGSRRQRRAAIVRAVVERGEITHAELGDALGLDAAEISGLVADLARDGLLVAGDGHVRPA
jgi:A/G-specific adenine glycosylase